MFLLFIDSFLATILLTFSIEGGKSLFVCTAAGVVTVSIFFCIANLYIESEDCIKLLFERFYLLVARDRNTSSAICTTNRS